MISNPEGTALFSSIGWVERDAIWRFDVARGATETISLGSGASYCSLHCGHSDRFAITHHFEGRRFEVSVRSYSEPARVLAKALVEEGRSALTGDPTEWSNVSRLYVEFLVFAPWKDFVLIRVSSEMNKVEMQRLEWYAQSYDKDYQSVIDVLELPGNTHAVVSVQRSSELILHDLKKGTKARSIKLCGRGGNPKLQLRSSGKELWATDYDTLVVVRTKDWQVDRSSRVQYATSGTQQLIGDFSFAPDHEICLVARPFNADVVGIDPRTLRRKYYAKLGRQPLEVAALRQGELVARDWKTGDLLRGTLKRRWFVI